MQAVWSAFACEPDGQIEQVVAEELALYVFGPQAWQTCAVAFTAVPGVHASHAVNWALLTAPTAHSVQLDAPAAE